MVQSVADRATHDVDLGVHGLGRHRRDRLGSDCTGGERRIDADDVGVASCIGEHALAAATDQQWWAGLLHRLGETVVVGDGVVLAGEVGLAVGEALTHDLDALDHAVDAHAGGVIRHAGLFVVAHHPTGTHAELDATAAQDVHRRDFLGEHDGMFVVVVPYERADAQVLRRVGGAHECGNWSELIGEVVGHRQHIKAVGLRALGECDPRRCVGGAVCLDAETEGLDGELNRRTHGRRVALRVL